MAVPSRRQEQSDAKEAAAAVAVEVAAAVVGAEVVTHA